MECDIVVIFAKKIDSIILTTKYATIEDMMATVNESAPTGAEADQDDDFGVMLASVTPESDMDSGYD